MSGAGTERHLCEEHVVSPPLPLSMLMEYVHNCRSEASKIYRKIRFHPSVGKTLPEHRKHNPNLSGNTKKAYGGTANLIRIEKENRDTKF